MDKAFNLREWFLTGLRADTESPINSPGLVTLENMRATGNGLVKFATINEPNDIGSTAFDWPFPQFFRGRERSLLMEETIINLINDTTFAKTPLTLKDIHGDTDTVDAGGGPWHVMDFGDTMMLFNGASVVYKTERDSDWHVINAVPLMTTGTDYNNGQAIMAGFDPTNIFSGLWTQFWNSYLADPSNPLPSDVSALVDTAVGPGSNWVMWSSIGGGDLLEFLDPYTLIDVTEDKRSSINNISNGTFTGNADDWTLGTGWACSANTVVATGATGNLSQANVDTANVFLFGHWYEITFTVSGYSGTNRLQVKLGDTLTKKTGGANGTFKERIFASGATLDLAFVPEAAYSATLDNITAFEIVSNEIDMSVNTLPILRNGSFFDEDIRGWNMEDGVSPWYAVRRNNLNINPKMYLATRAKSFYSLPAWAEDIVGLDIDDHGLIFIGGSDARNLSMELANIWATFDVTKFYEVSLVLTGNTAGTIDVRMGTGTTAESVETISGDGFHRVTLKSDEDPTFGTALGFFPTPDFVGKITSVNVEERGLIGDNGAAEAFKKIDANLTQLTADMFTPLVAGKRYQVTWTQQLIAGGNIIENSFIIADALVDWNVEDGSSSWNHETLGNIIKNPKFYYEDPATLGWIVGANWTWNAGTFRFDHATSSTARLQFPNTKMWTDVADATAYGMIFEMVGRTAGSVEVSLGTGGNAASKTTFSADGIFFGVSRDLIKDLAAANPSDLFLTPTSDFDGSIIQMQLRDKSLDFFDLNLGAANYTGQDGDDLAQDESQMNMNLIEGNNYTVSWVQENYDANVGGGVTVSNRVRPILGGNTTRGDGTSFLGGTPSENQKKNQETFSKTMDAGSGTKLEFEQEFTITGDSAIRVHSIRVVPNFNNGLRPIVGGDTTRTDGDSSFFNAVGITNQDIEIICGSGNLDLAFEPELEEGPVRVYDIQINEKDEESNLIEQRPSPILFDFFMRNERGFAPMPFQGTVQKVLQLGKNIMVYGDKFVGILNYHSSPVSVHVPHFLPGYPRTMGVASRNAAGGTRHEHVWVDERGELWHINSALELKRLRYDKFFAPMLGNEIQVVVDQEGGAFLIGDDVDTFYLKDFRLSKAPYHVTSLEFTQGGLVGRKEDVANPNDVVIVTEDIQPAGIGIHELEKVQFVSQHAASSTMPWTVHVNAKINTSDAFKAYGPFTPDQRGIAIIKVPGVLFQIELRNSEPANIDLHDVTAFFKNNGKFSIGKLLT